MALFAMIPNLGTFVVWGPAALLLYADGHWGKALILVVWGLTAIALIDNLLYPVLVGNRLRAHTVVAFISILGGIAVFGASGIVLGPLVVSLTVFLLELWRRRTEGGRAAETVA
jgi:predicted PurR-regulated permease PerM